MIETWQDIPGFFDFADIYDQAVSEARDGDILIEVGSFLGKSAAYMAERIRSSGKTLYFYAVDSWDEVQYRQWWVDVISDPPAPWPVRELMGKPLYEAFSYCISRVGAVDFIRPMRARSVEVARVFTNLNNVPFVFIDADHRYDGIRSDIGAWQGIVRPGGILAGHDYRTGTWPDVDRAVDEVFGARVEHRGNSWLVRM